MNGDAVARGYVVDAVLAELREVLAVLDVTAEVSARHGVKAGGPALVGAVLPLGDAAVLVQHLKKAAGLDG